MVLAVNRLRLIAAALVLSSAVAAAQQPTVPSPSRARPLLFGFALACTSPICEPGMRGRVGGPGNAGGANGSTDLRYPQVMAVAPGSAAERAGIRPGDVLQTIDGLSLLSAQGTERMAQAAAGERVLLGFDRHGKSMSFILELGLPSLSAKDVSKILTGYMSIQGHLHGDLKTEIWSDQPIYAFPDSTTGTVRFQIGTSTIVTIKYIKDSTDRANKPDSVEYRQWYR